MNRNICIVLVFLLLINLLTGCWSSKELNQIAILTALGIDKAENGYRLSAQVINPGEIAGKGNSGRTEAIRFIKTGATIHEAFQKLSTDVPRILYLSHLRVVIFGEDLARDGIRKALDFLSRDHEMRSDFYLVVAKGSSAADVLNIIIHQEKLSANKLYNALENSNKRWGPTTTVTLDELINLLVSKGKQPFLTGVYLYGNPDVGSDFRNVQDVSPKAGLRIDRIGVFKKDKLIGWLNNKESHGFNYVINRVSNTIVNVPCKGGKLSIETIRSKTKLNGTILKGKPRVDVSVTSEGNVSDVECMADVSNPTIIRELEKQYQNEIKKKIEAAVSKLQKDYHSDILGFGEVIYRKHPKAWKLLEPKWDQEFENLNVSVHVKAKIRRLGTITKSFQKEVEE